MGQKGVVKRPETKENKTVFIGSLDKEVIEVTKQAFPKHEIHVMDKDIFNKNVALFTQKNTKWKEDRDMVEFTSKPENIRHAFDTASKTEDVIKDIAKDKDGWFTLGELVKNSNMDYKQAQSILDLLYAFGLVVKDTRKEKLFKLISSKREKMDYLLHLRVELHAHLYDYDNMIKEVARETRMEEQIPMPELAKIPDAEELKRVAEKISNSKITESEKKGGLRYFVHVLKDIGETKKSVLGNISKLKKIKAVKDKKELVKEKQPIGNTDTK